MQSDVSLGAGSLVQGLSGRQAIDKKLHHGRWLHYEESAVASISLVPLPVTVNEVCRMTL